MKKKVTTYIFDNIFRNLITVALRKIFLDLKMALDPYMYVSDFCLIFLLKYYGRYVA